MVQPGRRSLSARCCRACWPRRCVIWASRRASTRDQRDLAFAMAATAMLLVSPITWDYSLPLLLVPLAILTGAARTSRWLPVLLVPVLTIFGLPQMKVMEIVLAGQAARVASPGFMLGVPSLNFYALLATLGMLAALAARRVGPAVP